MLLSSATSTVLVSGPAMPVRPTRGAAKTRTRVGLALRGERTGVRGAEFHPFGELAFGANVFRVDA
jgi:hypothetical protein